MPQGRNNPLRPRNRNAATSNLRATPYSRPISPPVRTQGPDGSNVAHSIASEATVVRSSADTETSSSAPAFTQTDAPRSPFAFPRPERDAHQQANSTSGHVDRPPPSAHSQQSGDARDVSGAQGQNGFPSVDQDRGSNVVHGDMHEAVRMLQDLLARNERERRSALGNPESANGRTPANGTQAPAPPPDISAQRDNQAGDVQQNDQQNNSNNHSPNDHPNQQADGRSNRNQPRTIAIFEIALPDMSADMMPDTFQGMNDSGPRAFGPDAFQSFMVPFPNPAAMAPDHNINGSAGPSRGGAETMDISEDTRASAAVEGAGNDNAIGNSGAASEDAGGTSGSSASGQGQSPVPAHPGPHRMHRWLSDSDRPQGAPFLNLPILPPLIHRPDGESPAIERRRGDEPWHLPKVRESFTDWITSRERALKWRCDDPVCLYAPPEHPYTELTEDQWQEWKPTDEKFIKINSYKQHRFMDEEYTGPRPVCQHDFHPACLKVSCLSSNWWYREPGREETTVRCPKCRMQGWIVEEGGQVQPEDAINNAAAAAT